MTPKEVIEYGSLIIVFVVFINYISSLLRNKNSNEAKKNEIDNKHNTEMFNILKNQLEQYVELNNKIYLSEINEIKRLILNNSNMNVEDFEIFMKTSYSNIILQLEKEMFAMIERNHIDENTLTISLKKVDNLVDKIVNNNMYIVQALKFDNELIKQIAVFNSQEKEQIKSMLKEIITVYSKSKSEYKKEEAKRQVEENVKYINNAYESHLFSILERTN